MNDDEKAQFLDWAKTQYGWSDQTVAQYKGMLDKVKDFVRIAGHRWVKDDGGLDDNLSEAAEVKITIVELQESNRNKRTAYTLATFFATIWLLIHYIMS